MSGLLRDGLLREKIFLISLPPPTQHSISFLVSHSVSSSDGPWMLHANERHCCGFNANQRRTNIHLGRWLNVQRGTVPTWNAKLYVFFSWWSKKSNNTNNNNSRGWAAFNPFMHSSHYSGQLYKHYFFHWTGCQSWIYAYLSFLHPRNQEKNSKSRAESQTRNTGTSCQMTILWYQVNTVHCELSRNCS